MSYVMAVRELARYIHRASDQHNKDELHAYFLYLVKERQQSDANCRLYRNAFRFFYLEVLGQEVFEVKHADAQRNLRIPELLQRSVIIRILNTCTPLKHRNMLSTCYGPLFRIDRETQQAFGEDPKCLSGQMGIPAVLHTWE